VMQTYSNMCMLWPHSLIIRHIRIC